MSRIPLVARMVLRIARRDKQQSGTVVATVALAVSALVATGAVVDALLVRPLPFRDSHHLAAIFTLPPNSPAANRNPLRSVDLVEFRDRLAPAVELAGITVQQSAVRVVSEVEPMLVGHATANLFSVLGSAPAVGRVFSVEEDEGRQGLAVLSHAVWQRAFGADPAIVGRRIVVDGEPVVVTGVMPEGFRTPFAESDVWMPLGVSRANMPLPAATYIIGIGRLAPGISVPIANQQVEAAMQILAGQRPRTHEGWTAGALSLREFQFGNQRQIVLILFVGALVLCLVAIINVANVTIAAVISRRTELRTSQALGASVRHLLVEQVTLTSLLMLAGSLLGLGLGKFLLRTFLSLNPGAFRTAGALDSWRIAVVAIGIMIVAGVAAGAIAVRAALRGPMTSSGARLTLSKRDRKARRWLSAAQVAAVIVLLAVAFSLGGALVKAARQQPGFEPAHALAVQLRMPIGLYQTRQQRAAALRTYLERIRNLPGVTSASATTNAFLPGSAIQTLIQLEGRPLLGNQPIPVQVRYIADDYFRTMQIPMLAGRPVGANDLDGAPLSAVVSAGLALQLWGSTDVLDKRLRRQQEPSQWFTVVGLAADVSDVQVGQPPVAILYLPYAQINFEVAPVSIVIRSHLEAATLAHSARAAIQSANPNQPLYRTAPLTDFVAASLAPSWFRTAMLGVTGMLGLLIAMVGIHGILGRSILERLREIAIRRALGATTANVALVGLSDAWTSLVAGTACGIPLAMLGLSRLTAAVPDVQGTTVVGLTLGTATVIAMVTAITLTHVPRVLRINTALTLKSE